MRPRALRLRHWVTSAALVGLFVLPALVELFDQPFLLDLFTRIMITAIAAVSLNLILGYGGMISFGHAAYIGIGAYAIGIPAYYELHDGFLQLAVTVGASALFALVTGYICLRTRGVYFIMITLAFAQMVFFAFTSIEEYGGDDGLVIEQRSEFPLFLDLASATELYYVVFVLLAAALYLVHRIVNSRFGMVVQGSKFNDARMQAVGFNTSRYRLVCYVIAGTMCGISGWLLGNFNVFVSSDFISWIRSGELIFMVVLGGTGTVFGPVLGTAVFLILEEELSSISVYWPLVFGPFLILVVLFAKGGLMGAIDGLEGVLRERDARPDDAP